MSTPFLTEIKQRPVAVVLDGLLSDQDHISTQAGLRLAADARKYGLDLKSYLTLAINKSDDHAELDGFEQSLVHLKLPVRDDYKNGVLMQMASDTFQTYPGTRAMFPPVIDTLLHWAVRQDQIEKTDGIVSQKRTINGNELISVVVSDDSNERDTFRIAESARIPVRSIQTTENSVKIYKHGSGIRTSYEFSRRAALDVITPFAARVVRELERSKVAAVTNLLINGDAAYAAAPVVAQSSFAARTNIVPTNGSISWPNMLAWLVDRAKYGTPVDTVVGNWDSAFNWAMLWQVPIANASGTSAGQNLQNVSERFFQLNIPLPQFQISSGAPAGQLIGFLRAETAEELTEAGSTIAESEKSIQNQTITYVKTENTGYRLAWGDTRSIYNYMA